MTRLRSMILLSIPLLALVAVGFLIANQQSSGTGWLIGAYVSLGLLVIAGLMLSERPDLFGSIEAQAPEPTSADLERVMIDGPVVTSPMSLIATDEAISERATSLASSADPAATNGSPVEPGTESTELNPFSLVDPPSVAAVPILPAVPSAEEQAVVDSKVAEIFLNLGRRNKHLIRQMLTLVSHLEHDQLAPEIQEGLVELDHLATRMKRNEETLLMLASSRRVRQWSQPVSAERVLSDAVAEVERHARVQVDEVPDVEILGSVVSDVTHLLAELIDNATEFSHNSTSVTVSTHTTLEGLEIEVLDAGHGIDEDKLTELNSLLADPPLISEAPSRRLGLFIAAHFANEHNIGLELSGQRGIGTVATISLPHDVLVELEDADDTPSLEALDLVDPIHAFALGSELAEADEAELAEATFPSVEDVEEAFPTAVPATMNDFPSLEGVLPEVDSEDGPKVVDGISPLPSRISQATFEPAWDAEGLNVMPAPGIASFGSPDQG